MAVFTPVTQLELEEFISPAQLGQLVSFEGILQGVDNTNYKIETTTGKYILTIFESRINPADGQTRIPQRLTRTNPTARFCCSCDR